MSRAAGQLGIGQLRCRPAEHKLVGRKFGEPHRERGLQHPVAGRVGRREGGQMGGAIDVAKDCGGKAADQPVGLVRDGVEHRLHVRRGRCDDLQDISGGRLPLQRFPCLVEQRAFSIAITAWSANVCSS